MAVRSPFGQILVVEKVDQYEKSENRRFPRKYWNYNLRREKVDSDYNYKRRETVVGSHVPIIIAVNSVTLIASQLNLHISLFTCFGYMTLVDELS